MKSCSMVPGNYLRASSVGLAGTCERSGNFGGIRNGWFHRCE